MKRITVVLLGLLSGCGSPPCSPITQAATMVCSPRDGGLPNTIRATTYVGSNAPTSTACTVSVSGQVVSLSLTGTVCAGGNQSNPIAAIFTADCELPSLANGVYSVAGVMDSTFSVPADAGDTLPSCQ